MLSTQLKNGSHASSLFMGRFPQHYMQTSLWAGLKSQYGWKTELLHFENSIFYSYKRTVLGHGALHYLPNMSGINKDNAARFTSFARNEYKKGFVVKLELYQPYNDELLASMLAVGWKLAKNHVQYRDTVMVDLTPPQDDIFYSFKSRCRNEARKAVSLGVEIEEVEANDNNLKLMYELMHATSKRNGFYIRDNGFTESYWKTFSSAGQLHLYFAKYNNEILAGAVVLTNGQTGWYKDGGSMHNKGNLMGPRLMQWEIMKKLKSGGITLYDLSGVPATSEHQTSSMRGIYTFKTGYSKEIVTLMPALELPLSPSYKLWSTTEQHWLRAYNLFARNLWY